MPKGYPKVSAEVQDDTPPKYVSEERFSSLENSVSQIIDLLSKKGDSVPVAKEAKEVEKAKSDDAPINPAWEEMAREIIGPALSHCEVFYPKGGGQIFTIIINREFSNAPIDYLERHKADRRSKEIGSEGMSGVENWCKLVKSNLSRPNQK